MFITLPKLFCVSETRNSSSIQDPCICEVRWGVTWKIPVVHVRSGVLGGPLPRWLQSSRSHNAFKAARLLRLRARCHPIDDLTHATRTALIWWRSSGRASSRRSREISVWESAPSLSQSAAQRQPMITAQHLALESLPTRRNTIYRRYLRLRRPGCQTTASQQRTDGVDPWKPGWEDVPARATDVPMFVGDRSGRPRPIQDWLGWSQCNWRHSPIYLILLKRKIKIFASHFCDI